MGRCPQGLRTCWGVLHAMCTHTPTRRPHLCSLPYSRCWAAGDHRGRWGRHEAGSELGLPDNGTLGRGLLDEGSSLHPQTPVSPRRSLGSRQCRKVVRQRLTGLGATCSLSSAPRTQSHQSGRGGWGLWVAMYISLTGVKSLSPFTCRWKWVCISGGAE